MKHIAILAIIVALMLPTQVGAQTSTPTSTPTGCQTIPSSFWGTNGNGSWHGINWPGFLTNAFSVSGGLTFYELNNSSGNYNGFTISVVSSTTTVFRSTNRLSTFTSGGWPTTIVNSLNWTVYSNASFTIELCQPAPTVTPTPTTTGTPTAIDLGNGCYEFRTPTTLNMNVFNYVRAYTGGAVYVLTVDGSYFLPTTFVQWSNIAGNGAYTFFSEIGVFSFVVCAELYGGMPGGPTPGGIGTPTPQSLPTRTATIGPTRTATRTPAPTSTRPPNCATPTSRTLDCDIIEQQQTQAAILQTIAAGNDNQPTIVVNVPTVALVLPTQDTRFERTQVAQLNTAIAGDANNGDLSRTQIALLSTIIAGQVPATVATSGTPLPSATAYGAPSQRTAEAAQVNAPGYSGGATSSLRSTVGTQHTFISTAAYSFGCPISIPWPTGTSRPTLTLCIDYTEITAINLGPAIQVPLWPFLAVLVLTVIGWLIRR